MLVRNGEAGPVTQIATTIIPPGEICESHQHLDMWEAFLVVSGDGEIVVDCDVITLAKGHFVLVEPGELHELRCHQAEKPLELIVMSWTGVRNDDSS